MKLFFSPASPFVRKCMVIAHELALTDRIEKLPSAAGPVARDKSIIPSNPLGKVPTLITDDGQVLYDSRVICEFLNDLGGGTLFPANGPARWQALADQALGDGVMDAALLARYEVALRPEALRWTDWVDGQLSKAHDALAQLERRGPPGRPHGHRHDCHRLRPGLSGLPLRRLRLARHAPRRCRLVQDL